MKDMNQCLFTGNLAADPEVKHLASGTTLATFRIACNQDYMGRDNQKVERTEWVRVSAFGKLADNVIAKYLRKGSRVLVQGEMRTRSWDDSEGNKRYMTEIHLGGPASQLIMLGGKDGKEQRPTTATGGKRETSGQVDAFNDDVPF